MVSIIMETITYILLDLIIFVGILVAVMGISYRSRWVSTDMC